MGHPLWWVIWSCSCGKVEFLVTPAVAGAKSPSFSTRYGATESCPDNKQEFFSSLFRRVPREPVTHHGKTVPQRLKPINLARLYGTAEAVPFVPTAPGAQFCGFPSGLVTVSTYPYCRRKRHFGRL
jgi:hypothetical protein